MFTRWAGKHKKINKEYETPRGEEDDRPDRMKAEKNDESVLQRASRKKSKLWGFKGVYFKIESFYSP